MRSGWAVVVAAALVAGHVSSANADAVFADDFNSYASSLNWAPPANWTVSAGSVDLIGINSGFDFFMGNGGYVDLDGSTDAAGTLKTLTSFGPGSYTLTFDLGGNARGDVDKTTVITLGSFTTSITLASTDPYELHTLNFSTTTGGQLSFADLASGNADIGNILDNVSLVAVPGPTVGAGASSFAFAALFAWLVRRRAYRTS